MGLNPVSDGIGAVTVASARQFRMCAIAMIHDMFYRVINALIKLVKLPAKVLEQQKTAEQGS